MEKIKDMSLKMKWLALVCCLITCKAFSQEQKKMNVLFIIADDLTTTAVSSYGSKCQTPNIDKIAAEGVQYNKAYCQFPVCGPSRASLMSGYYPHATTTFGYTVWEISDEAAESYFNYAYLPSNCSFSFC